MGRMEQDQDEAMITGEAAGHCTGDGRGAGHSQLWPQLPASASTRPPPAQTLALLPWPHSLLGGGYNIVLSILLSMEVLICNV